MKKIFTILSFVALGISANAQTNLINNSGFETWTDTNVKPDNWSYMVKGYVETTKIHSGNQAIRLSGEFNTATPPANVNAEINQDVTAKPSTQYTIAYWFLDNDGNQKGRHWVQARTANANITWSSPMQPSTYSTDSPEWKYVTATATTPANTEILRVGYRSYAENSTGPWGSIYLDDFVLVEGTLATIDIKDFDKKVKMNTLVSDNLTLIELPYKSTVNIYSVDGKLVSSNRVNSGESINVSKLQKGNYIVTVEDGTNKVSRKIVKK